MKYSAKKTFFSLLALIAFFTTSEMTQADGDFCVGHAFTREQDGPQVCPDFCRNYTSVIPLVYGNSYGTKPDCPGGAYCYCVWHFGKSIQKH